MGYFDEVYLKRINRFGNNIQERIQNKREYDFEETILKKSPNQVSVWEGLNSWDEAEMPPDYLGILQTKEYDQDEIVDYLLVPCDRKIQMGKLLYFMDVRHKKREHPWLAYAVDPYTTGSHNRYTVIELEEKMEWYVDGIYHSSPVHAVGGGSGARDKNINLKFRVQFAESGVYLPNKRYSIVMPYNSTIKKNNKVTIGGETWRITGFDKISVNGVMYITLEEYLTDKNDDVPVAGRDENANWYITTPLGSNFEIPTKSDGELSFITFYKEKEKSIEITPTLISEKEEEERIIPLANYEIISLEEDGKFYSGKIFKIRYADEDRTDACIRITIKDQADTAQDFDFTFKENIANKIGIIGPDVVTMGQKITYTITGTDSVTASLSNTTCATIDTGGTIGNKVVIEAKEIGTTVLDINSQAQLPIEIQSFWLGGKKDNVDS